MEEQIINALRKITGKENIELEIPDMQFGDFSSNIALKLKTKKSEKPRESAEKIIEKLKEDREISKIVERIETAGPGFINFWLNKDILIDNLIQIDHLKEKYGSSNTGKEKTVIIDFSSPNIAKRFSIGHLRSTIIGQSLYNLYKLMGYQVIGDNHLGDWGTQFGKLLYMINSKKLNTDSLSIDKLEDLYIEFHELAEKSEDIGELENEAREWFKKLEDGDKDARKLWKYCVDVSMEEFENIYKILDVTFDYQYGESFYESEMKLLEKDKNVGKTLILGQDGKSKVIDLTKYGIKTPLMFKKSDGATTYATRDLACIRFRMRKWQPSIVIYEVGGEQMLHFEQVFAAARILGLVNQNVTLFHTKHGLYLSSDGKKFKTRKGGTIRLEEILKEATRRAGEIIQKSQTSRGLIEKDIETVAEKVGIGAIKYFDLMHSIQSDIVFNWEKVMNLQGNSGPYLQYTYARIQSVLRKAKAGKFSFNNERLKLNNEEGVLIRMLSRYSGVISDAAKNYSPNLLCNYLFDLTQKFNNFYEKCKIIGNENSKFRLLLTSATGQIIKNGLSVLGIGTLEKM